MKEATCIEISLLMWCPRGRLEIAHFSSSILLEFMRLGQSSSSLAAAMDISSFGRSKKGELNLSSTSVVTWATFRMLLLIVQEHFSAQFLMTNH